MRRHLLPTAIALALSLALTRPAGSTEICGNHIDDDSDGLADNGCNPAAVTGVDESPLRSAAGTIAPKTGQLVYPELPDLVPNVAYGPPLVFQRTYMSQYDPGYNDPGATDFRAPFGYGWHHNFMSWLDKDITPNPDQVIVHLTTGQDVLFTYSQTSGGYDEYTPQPGYHFAYLRQSTSSPYGWELKTLTGTTYEYDWADPTGKLTAIDDAVGNQLTITYNTGGQIDTVTDASGYKQLVFGYGTSGAKTLSTLKYYNDGTLRDTISYSGGYELDTTIEGSLTVRSYDYDSNHKLTQIADSSVGTVEASFDYLDAAAGKAVRIEVATGHLGYGYGDSGCDSGNGLYVFYNLASTSETCDADADCASGEYCGGETNPANANTGKCYRARRCVTLSSPNEDLVGAVTSSCSSCTDTAQYSWDTGTSGDKVNLSGTEDADGVWTSYLYNADGLVTEMVENDDDDDASTVPTGARVTYYFYGNPSFPALVTEIRHLSELKPTGTCTATNPADCKRILYSYTSGGQMSSREEKGFTYDGSGSVVALDYTTTFSHDSEGRLTEVDGPRTDTSYDVTEYTYWSSSDHLKDGHLHQIKRQKDASTYITTSFDAYDSWGHATTITDPNSNVTCLTYASDRGVLTERRVAMNNQTDCSTSNSADLTTSYSYDEGMRLTRVEKPLGNCTFYTYDSTGRLSTIKDRDDCTISSSGNNIEYGYDADGLQVSVQYKDASGTVTYEQHSGRGEDRRPTATYEGVDENHQLLSYEPDGMLSSVTTVKENLDPLAETGWTYDNLNRATAEERHNSSTTYDTWTLTPGVQLDLPTEVLDDSSKAIDWVWDDLGRKVAQTTPEGGTTIYVYDPAGNLTTKVEAQDDADEMTTTYSYDPLNRLTAEDTGDANCYTLGGAEIQYTYDSPSGCPSGTCVDSNGRLAYVKTQMWCDDSESDDSFDQITYYGYDDAGRTIKEAIRDDGGRSADQSYGWNKNSEQTWIDNPSSSTYYSDYGTDADSDNSNMDKVVTTKLSTFLGPIYYTVNGTWFPFGPMKSYTQQNTRNAHTIVARFQWDPAYRPKDLVYEETSTGADLLHIAYSRDDAGRVTVRDFSSQQSGVQDDYFTYDFQGRVNCDSAASGTCPSSGSNLKSNIGGYDASNERTSITHQSANYATDTYSYTYVSGSHEVDHVTKGDTYDVNFGWDGRGNRLYDDDDEWGKDRRDYTYDGRDNLITVSGTMRVPAGLGFTEHSYTETNAYDHKNRRIFKSVLDEDTSVESQWFFYYDLQDRLIYVKYTPDISDSTTYNLFTFLWIGPRPIYYQEQDYVSGSYTSAGYWYLHADELNRPLEAWTRNTSGDTSRVWALNPDAFGWDDLATGSGLYQPLRFPGQYQDEETIARTEANSTYPPARPPLSDNRYRVFDPFTSSYLQADPEVGSTWSAYAYVQNNPVGQIDPDGLMVDEMPGRPDPRSYDDGMGPFPDCFDPYSWCGGPPNGGSYPVGGGGGGGGGGGSGGGGTPQPGCDPNDYATTPQYFQARFLEKYCPALDASDPKTWSQQGAIYCVCSKFTHHGDGAPAVLCLGKLHHGPLSIFRPEITTVWYECEWRIAGSPRVVPFDWMNASAGSLDPAISEQ